MENRSGTSDILYRYGVFGASYNTTVPDVCFNCFNQQGHVFGTSATQWSVNNNLGGKLNDEYIDPGMVDWANGDCRPASKKSAVVDKGVTQPWMTAGKVTDLAGENRLYGVAVDIGCYEYRPEVIGTLFSCR